MSIVLRTIREGEQDKLLALVTDVLQQYGLKPDPEGIDRDIRNIDNYYLNRGGCFKILDEDGEIVGSYGLHPLSARVCELRKMYVRRDAQGKGYGAMMMDDALAEARGRGFKEMVLETNSILGKATELYRKYGFEEYPAENLSDRCNCAMRLKL